MRQLSNISWVLILLFLISPIASARININDHSDEDATLETILSKCAKYCETLRNKALFFVCREEIIESQFAEYPGAKRGITIHPNGLSEKYSEIRVGWSPGREVKRFVYDYQLIRKSHTNRIVEKRILISENYERMHEEDAELNTRFRHQQLALAPVAFFGKSNQRKYNYKIDGRENHRGETYYIIDVSPCDGIDIPGINGKAWIHSEDGSVTKIEWAPDSIKNLDAIELEAEILKADSVAIECSIEFKFINDGIRYPNKYTIFENYFKKNRKMYTRSRTIVRYEDYKFFTVNTDVKYLPSFMKTDFPSHSSRLVPLNAFYRFY